ncbi:MAG: hypothetical protein KGK07_17120, partial [Chloroflexota bacterium]|nr:hypothetical protein [Chloroflexota bacterium]
MMTTTPSPTRARARSLGALLTASTSAIAGLASAAAGDEPTTSGAGAPSGVPSGVPLRADFNIYTGALSVAGTQSAEGLTRVHAIGSSTIEDLQGDTMELSALQSMTRAAVGLLIFLNHSYNTPEDVAGHLALPPAITMQNGISDLALAFDLYTYKERIAAVARDILSGGRHGVSIGCLVLDGEWRGANGEVVDQDTLDFWDIITGAVKLHILDVLPLEWSIVGIPANQRSWVQQAARGLLERGLATLAAPALASDTDNADDAAQREQWALEVQRLAPLVRSWWPTSYPALIRNSGLRDSALVNDLLRAPARQRHDQVLWTPGAAPTPVTPVTQATGDTATVVTSDAPVLGAWVYSAGGVGASRRTQPLTRGQVEALLAQQQQQQQQPQTQTPRAPAPLPTTPLMTQADATPGGAPVEDSDAMTM